MRSPVGDENGLTLIGSSGIADLRNEIPGRGRELLLFFFLISQPDKI